MTSTAHSCRPKRAAKLALLAAGLLLLQPAMARKDDRQQPANVTSKAFDGTQADVVHYKGNVVLTQGTLKVTGNLATAYIDQGNSITRIVVNGTPAHIQQVDDSGNLMQGDAAEIDYDNVKQIAVLIGNASVTQQGRGTAHGDKLTYNTQTSQMTGESNGDGLVHMTFLPKPKSAAVPGAAPAKKKHHHHGAESTPGGAAGTTPASAASQGMPKSSPGHP